MIVMSFLLEVTNLHVHYGAIEAVKGIDFSLQKGKITTLLGSNGAGKSTTLLALSGLLDPSAGTVLFDGHEICGRAPHQIVDMGIVQVPEGREILATLTVRENLLLGAYRRRHDGDIHSDLEKILTLFPRLRDRLGGAAGNLSGGEQQMLAIARALMARPKLLLLDEPSMGLAPLLVREIFLTLAQLRQSGLTILLVEQNARQGLKIADDGYVMEDGVIVLSGPSDDLLQNKQVIAAYLGG
jgi:branched-chain amino acid transport system ATP-binding protein